MSNGHLHKPAASRCSQTHLGCFPQLRQEMEGHSEFFSDSHIPCPAWEAPWGLLPETSQTPAVSPGPSCLPPSIWKTVGVPTWSPCFCLCPAPHCPDLSPTGGIPCTCKPQSLLGYPLVSETLQSAYASPPGQLLSASFTSQQPSQIAGQPSMPFPGLYPGLPS